MEAGRDGLNTTLLGKCEIEEGKRLSRKVVTKKRKSCRGGILEL